MYDRIRPYPQPVRPDPVSTRARALRFPCFYPDFSLRRNQRNRLILARARIVGLYFVPFYAYFVHQEKLSGLCASRLSAIMTESLIRKASKPHNESCPNALRFQTKPDRFPASDLLNDGILVRKDDRPKIASESQKTKNRRFSSPVSLLILSLSSS